MQHQSNQEQSNKSNENTTDGWTDISPPRLVLAISSLELSPQVTGPHAPVPLGHAVVPMCLGDILIVDCENEFCYKGASSTAMPLLPNFSHGNNGAEVRTSPSDTPWPGSTYGLIPKSHVQVLGGMLGDSYTAYLQELLLTLWDWTEYLSLLCRQNRKKKFAYLLRLIKSLTAFCEEIRWNEKTYHSNPKLAGKIFRKATNLIDLGNKALGLPVTPRNSEGLVVYPHNTTALYIYKLLEMCNCIDKRTRAQYAVNLTCNMGLSRMVSSSNLEGDLPANLAFDSDGQRQSWRYSVFLSPSSFSLVQIGGTSSEGEESLQNPLYQVLLQLKSFSNTHSREEVNLHFSLYDFTQDQFITDEYIVTATASGVALDTGTGHTLMQTLFSDMSSKDLDCSIYLVCKIVRVGSMVGCAPSTRAFSSLRNTEIVQSARSSLRRTISIGSSASGSEGGSSRSSKGRKTILSPTQKLRRPGGCAVFPVRGIRVNNLVGVEKIVDDIREASSSLGGHGESGEGYDPSGAEDTITSFSAQRHHLVALIKDEASTQMGSADSLTGNKFNQTSAMNEVCSIAPESRGRGAGMSSDDDDSSLVAQVYSCNDEDFHQIHKLIIEQMQIEEEQRVKQASSDTGKTESIKEGEDMAFVKEVTSRNDNTSLLTETDDSVLVSLKCTQSSFSGIRNSLVKAQQYNTLSITPQKGHREILSPGESRNDMFVTIKQGLFRNLGKNIELFVDVCRENGDVVARCEIMNVSKLQDSSPFSTGSNGPGSNRPYRSVVLYHNQSPVWEETVHIKFHLDYTVDINLCNLRFVARQVSSSEPPPATLKLDRNVLIGYLALMENTNTVLNNGHYNIGMLKYGTDTKLPAKYLSLTKKEFKDHIDIDINICSTSLINNQGLLSIVRWQHLKTKYSADDIVNKLSFISGTECVYFLDKIFNGLLSILEEDPENNGFCVFNALIFTFNVVIGNRRYAAFLKHLDALILSYSFTGKASKYLFESLLHYGVNYKSKGNMFRKAIKCIGFLFSCICQSSLKAPRKTEVQANVRRNVVHFFRNILKNIFEDTDPSLIGTKSTLIRHVPDMLIDLQYLFQPQEVAGLYCSLLFKIDTQKTENQILKQHVFQASQRLICSPLYEHSLSRKYINQLGCQLSADHLKGRKKWDIDNKYTLFCIDLIETLTIRCFKYKVSEENDVEEMGDFALLAVSISRFLIDSDIQKIKPSPSLQKLLSCFADLAHVMMEPTIDALFYIHEKKSSTDSLPQNSKSLKRHSSYATDHPEALFTMFKGFNKIVHYQRKYFIPSWTISTLTIIFKIVTCLHIAAFNPYRNALLERDWFELIDTSATVTNSPILNLSSYSTVKRSLVMRLFGDIRLDALESLRASWSKISSPFKTGHCKELSKIVVKLSSIENLKAQKNVFSLIWEVILVDYNAHKNLSIIGNELFILFDHLYSSNKLPSTDFLARFKVYTMDRLEQQPQNSGPNSLYEQGRRFLKTLGNYFEVISALKDDVVSAQMYSEERTHAIIKVLLFAKSIQQEDIFDKYAKLLEYNHYKNKNYTEAGFSALLTTARLPIPQKGHSSTIFYEAVQKNTNANQRAIQYFMEGQAWELASHLCNQLLRHFEQTSFDFIEAAKLLRLRANCLEYIETKPRIHCEYFYVEFNGSGFPASIRGKSYIYKGLQAERTMEFKARIQQDYPRARVDIASGSSSSERSGEADKDGGHVSEAATLQVIRIMKVDPDNVEDGDEVNQSDHDREKVTNITYSFAPSCYKGDDNKPVKRASASHVADASINDASFSSLNTEFAEEVAHNSTLIRNNASVPNKVKLWHLKSNIDRFSHSQPFKKTASSPPQPDLAFPPHGIPTADQLRAEEYANLWIRKVYYHTDGYLPSISLRVPVAAVHTTEIPPLTNALHTMWAKNEELVERINQVEGGAHSKEPKRPPTATAGADYSSAQKHTSGDNSDTERNNTNLIDPLRETASGGGGGGQIHLLTMTLNGVIDAAVNGGVAMYKHAFLSERYLAQHPQDHQQLRQLYQSIKKQIHILERGLEVHRMHMKENLRPLQDKMEEQFWEMKLQYEVETGAPPPKNTNTANHRRREAEEEEQEEEEEEEQDGRRARVLNQVHPSLPPPVAPKPKRK
eukprot:Nk52_evm17s271 gene=Nk52_evmTU17s271